MNDNQEKNSFDETESETEATPVPFAKKVAKFSAFIYLGLAITVVIVATVGIFSISYDYEDSLEPVSFPEIGYTDDNYSVPQITITPDVSLPDSPVGNDQSGVDADVSEPVQRVMFYRPVEGDVLKRHSMDALVYSETMGDYRVHSGIDIAAEVGTEVLAFTDGTVSSIVDDYFYGTTVAITHSQGLVSYYMNLDPTLAASIAVGSEVFAGQPLGYVGETARTELSDEPHLHFELRVNDTLIDPEPELP